MIKPDELGINDEEQSKDVIKLFRLGTKRLADPKYMQDFNTIEGRGRRLLKTYGRPFNAVPNAYFVPEASFPELKQKLDELRDEYTAAADAFEENYETIRDERLEEYYQYALENLHPGDRTYAEWFQKKIAGYYPPADQVRCRFDFQYTIFKIGDPGEVLDAEDYLADVNVRRELQNTYKEQTKVHMGAFLEQTATSLRVELSKAVEHLKEMLTGDKKFTNKSLLALQAKVQKIKNLNFLDDKKVSDKIVELSEYITIDASEYREDKDFANEFAGVLSNIGEDLQETLEEDVDLLVENWGSLPPRRLKLIKKKERV